ncbi:hypothetical protein CR513_12064, partial [Mucuna pruriens]
MGNVRILEEVGFGKEENITNVVFEEESVNDIGQVLVPITVQETTLVIGDNVQTTVPNIIPEQDYDKALPQTPIKQPQQVPLRRSIRERRHAILDDYIVFFQEHEDGIGLTEDDPINFCQAMQSSNSQKWIDAMKDELKSMQDNDVWDLVKLPEGHIERYEACLVAKGFTQKEDIDYKETFSPVSSKDSFRIVMVLVAHFDLELHQMDVKTVFLNGDIDEMIYMMQPENFVLNESMSPVCKLKKFIYGLKQASRQWYHKFHQVITSYGFEENLVDDCVYHKFSGSKYIFLVLYIDDILLASSDTGLLHETKIFLMKNFEMKDLREASFVLGIQILRNNSQGILRLSQENYISKVLERFSMKDSKPRDTLIAKGDKFSLKQFPNNDLERNKMQKIPYASIVGSLMYAQVCTRLNSAFVVGVLGSYLSDPGVQHWKAIKRVMRYLRRTKGHTFTYRNSEDLEIIEYSNSDFAGCQDSKHSTFGYIYMLARGAISWKSVKQNLIVPSTMAADFVAYFEASNQGIWLRNFVTSLRVVDDIERPLKIYCDNNSAILYSNKK